MNRSSTNRQQRGRLRFGQINLQGSMAATRELGAIAREKGLDMVLVQEQYNDAGEWMLQEGAEAKAGIFVVNHNLGVTVLRHLSSSHCLVVSVDTGGGPTVVVVSAYFQYSHDIGHHIEKMEYVIACLPGRQLLIGVDSNAHSQVWFCEERQCVGRGRDNDYRRSQMEEFIMGRDLLIHNVMGQPPTYCGPTGSSNIDLTLSTRGLQIGNWKVWEGVSISDHQLITFEIGDGVGNPATTGVLPTRFRSRGVDWSNFCSAIHARVGKLSSGSSASRYCEKLTSIITQTARDCIGVCHVGGNRGYEWWSSELDEMRRGVSRARRAWQRSKRTKRLDVDSRHNDLVGLRKKYKVAMKEAEMGYFRDIAGSGNDDPWGQAYREACGRRRPPPNVISGIELLGGTEHTEAVGETMTAMLAALFPDDNVETDSPYHRRVRLAAACAPPGDDAPMVEIGVLDKIVQSLPNTAPGADGITAKIVKHAWKVASREIYMMVQQCIEGGVFPEIWKEGTLAVLPKGNGKLLTDPKAYRPITLLPVLGKLLERVIIACAPGLRGGISSSQHGFTRGRSAVTAIAAINDIAEGSTEQYVQLILLDISGAFDNAWWPMVLVKAKQSGVAPNIYRILVEYFNNRRVKYKVGTTERWKKCTMGCPQGSVLGPTLWNLLLNDILLLPVPNGVHLVAYADDVTVVIEASSRADIERKAEDTLRAISDWGARNKLKFSASKTSTMTYKGRLKRPPTIRMDGASVTSVAMARALGVTLDGARSYLPHARNIGDRAAKCFGKVSRVSASSWGIRYGALRVLYSGTFVATVTYAAAVWSHRSSAFVVRRALLSAQRPALILLTKAFRSVSTAALPVLAGVLPADLEVLCAGRFAEEGVQLAPRERRKLRRDIRGEIVSLWQDRWTSSGDGRELYSFFPSIGERLKWTWVEPDHVTSQLLSGHGCFRRRLHNMSLQDTSMCPCGGDDEDRDHVLWSCPLYDEERGVLFEGVMRTVVGPISHADLVSTRECFAAFRTFAHSWYGKRREYERRGADMFAGRREVDG